MKLLDEKEDIGAEMFVPGNVIEDSVGNHYIVITTKRYDNTSGAVTYGGCGATNIKNGKTFLYDSLDDLKRVLMPVAKKTVHGKHTVDFDVKGGE